MAKIHYGLRRLPEVKKTEGPISRINEDEVREAIKKAKKGKAVGPDGVQANVYKFMGEEGANRITELFNTILEEGRMQEG